jgi:CheY-like chemotaxis protein
MPAAALIIAAQNLMPALRERIEAEGEVLTFADTEPIQALQAILEQRPTLIVLERLFAATPRGAALINRIKSDPQLGASEVRVMSHTGEYSRQVVKPSIVATASVAASTTTAPASARAEPDEAPEEAPEDTPQEEPPSRPLDWHGTRRAPRHLVRDGIEMQLDGNPAAVIDLSTVGAQVLSPTILRPNQKVRIALPNDDFVMRFRGAIAWAKFELPKSPSRAPQYRAGVEFTDADSSALEAFCSRFRQ